MGPSRIPAANASSSLVVSLLMAISAVAAVVIV